jgi:long-chain acyl-CoA synthetase
MANLYFFDNGGFNFTENDVHISYLPLGHAYEQSLFQTSIAKAIQIGFFSGDAVQLMADMAVLKPTLFFTVPRILNRLYDKIREGITKKSAFAQWLFNKGLAAKTHYLETEGTNQHKLYDPVVFNKVRELLGGRVRCVVTGSAPINAEVLTFLRVVLGVSVHEGYGSTEGLLLSITDAADNSYGTVGGPAPGIKFRIRDLPEMNYLSTDNPPRGEL